MTIRLTKAVGICLAVLQTPLRGLVIQEENPLPNKPPAPTSLPSRSNRALICFSSASATAFGKWAATFSKAFLASPSVAGISFDFSTRK
ncbi:MAG: hypothetical protein BWY37_02117 [Firmicutes bacterium ADurb.Bin262]|nr:MAG: hypothetical protein BWY37_02117 [Firmicutes bacterium ADurb.Bin262]